MNHWHEIAIVLVVAVVTALLRFLPFVVFNGKKETPKWISYLSNVLPHAIMGMLVIYCLKNVTVFEAPYGLPELLASLLVIVLHVWKGNTLLSIASGTICYMFLIQAVF